MTGGVAWTRRNARKDSRLRTIVTIIFCLLAVPSIATEQSTGKPAKRKNVLVLFGSDRRDNRQLLDLIEAEIRPRVRGPITFYETYLTTSLDLKRYKAYEATQAETFRQTYGWMDLAGVYCGFGRQISKSSFFWSLRRPVGITHAG